MRISDWSSDVCSSDLLGTTIAPLFGGLLILAAAPPSPEQLAVMPAAEALAWRTSQAQAVQGPYLGLAVTLFVLAAIVMGSGARSVGKGCVSKCRSRGAPNH